ncbi:MAG: T9SS type A sorting domain-containing protein [Lewinellaceae bacterium]|nr:T9SS type A sorting domain-containing protein [Phaeodactylibacter sp.]MCB9349995.1 T9SS type A sorting domain-containing protein [Lewinellaceae bacterium]
MPKLYLFALLTLMSSFVLRGQGLIDATYLESRTRTELATEFGFFINYGIDVYKVRYTTTDVQGQPDTASGALVIPQARGFALPLFIYQHGTSGAKDDVPSNLNISDYKVPLAFGGVGAVSLAPDYLGLGDSRGFHPYLHAATEASAAVDMLKAIGPYVAGLGQALNGQLFLGGYSQGGHASMALHRVLQEDYSSEYPVTAAAHMSGPYSLANVMREYVLSEDEYSFPGYIVRIILGLNEYYQIYSDFSQVFRAPYLGPAQAYYNNELTMGALHDTLATLLTQELGLVQPKYIIQDSVRQNILDNPNHPVNVALAENDVYDWAPQSPTRLFYCTSDEQVLYTNSLLADSVMNANGAPDVESANISSTLSHFDCARPALTQALLFFVQYLDVVSDAEEQAAEQSFRVYPNPTSGPLTVEGLSPGARLELYSPDGRRLSQLQAEGETVQLPVEGLAPGLYVLKLQGGDFRTVKKVVVK